MTIAKDKQKHLAGGLAAALIAGALWLLLAPICGAGIDGLPLVPFIGAAIAGIAKEGNDWVENRAAQSAGAPSVHEVSLVDLAYTMAPGAVLSVSAWVLIAAELGLG